MQLALVLAYPDPGPHQGQFVRNAAIQRLAVTIIAADHSAALPHARGFAALEVLRRLHHDGHPQRAAHLPHPTGWAARAVPGRFPRSLTSVATAIGAELHPGGIATATHRSLGRDFGYPNPTGNRSGQAKATTRPAPQHDPSWVVSRRDDHRLDSGLLIFFGATVTPLKRRR